MIFWTERKWAIGEKIYVKGRVLTCVQEISLEHVTDSTYVNINIRIGEPERCSRHSDEPRPGVPIPAKANSHLQNSLARLWGPLLNVYLDFFRGVKQPRSEVYSDQPNADDKNERSYTSTACKCLRGLQWRTQEFCWGEFNKFSWGQRDRGSGGR
jgi:hypothetical protein